ncbi:uncharacterized protein Z520_09239 [Fonsecaea multimorphosa CBS 102226]|uniref:GA4 desaturase n=1 Tax=Fonsecaea multimorphosa CBS 102226 TaxID=1442371 RepID=A0A0D2JWS2_9EURO|nr:uncharacterized protein Z520_09239 [Fonsecaea multimorphosa CBS 102226]KIX94929.1 hypothetical protein Z520_09239 [Fonsecaea multimorphosa CBS 102226]OAL20580.1 hypothetical protein AYO22_08589 [Fonsecaea multimorphosa]
MSLTTTATTTATASASAPAVVEAIFRYEEPDRSVPASERSLFSSPAPHNLREEKLPLHDYRSSTTLAKGAEGLHKHGFTVVEHHVDPSAWATERDVLDTYIPVVQDLVKSVTGCKTAIVNNVAFRRKLANKYDANKMFFHPRDGELDKVIGALPSDRPMVSPQEADKSLEPARAMHVDYTLKGLRDTIKHCRADMVEAGAEAIRAHEAGESRGPRVAAYSVWRPLKTVKRDPIAVLDWKSPGNIQDDLHAFDYRAKGYQGEYLLEAYTISRPTNLDDHKWYYVSEQKPHEVMMIKFADTDSVHDKDIAAAGGHGSPFVVGTEDEEPRESIEARVIAFW